MKCKIVPFISLCITALVSYVLGQNSNAPGQIAKAAKNNQIASSVLGATGVDGKPLEFLLRLSYGETLEYDLDSFRSDVIFIGVEEPSLPATSTSTVWSWQRNLIYSNSDDDCKIANYFASDFNLYGETIAYGPHTLVRGVMGRHMMVVDSFLYITTTTLRIVGQQASTVISTIAIPFNASSVYPQYTEVAKVQANLFAVTSNSTIFFYGRYLHTYSELLAFSLKVNNIPKKIFVNKTTSTIIIRTYQFQLFRSSTNMQTIFDTFQTNDLKLDVRRANFVIEPTLSGNYEVLFYMLNTSTLYNFGISRNQIFLVQKLALPFRILKLEYASKAILFFYGESDLNGKQVKNSFYFQKNPGDRFLVEEIAVFSDSYYLKSIISYQTSQLVIETVKFNDNLLSIENRADQFDSYSYNVLRYDLIERKFVQISSQLLEVIKVTDFYQPVVTKIDSFSNLKFVYLSENLLEYYYGTSKNVAPVKTNHVNAVLDQYRGIDVTIVLQYMYNLYNTYKYYDPLTKHNFLLTEAAAQRGTTGTLRACTLLRQRIGRPKVTVMNNQPNVTSLRNLTLRFFDRIGNVTTFYANYTFSNISELDAMDYPVWRSGNINYFGVSSFLRRQGIPLEYVSRGSFIISAIDKATGPYKYTSAKISDIDSLLAQNTIAVTSHRIENVRDMFIDQLDFVLALANSINTQLNMYYLLMRRSGTGIVNIYRVPPSGEIIASTPFTYVENVNKTLLLGGSKYLLVGEQSLLVFDTQIGQPTPLYFPGIACIDLDLLSSNNYRPTIVCLNQNYEFVIYFLDKVILRNFMDNMVILTDKISPKLVINKQARIYTTPFFE